MNSETTRLAEDVSKVPNDNDVPEKPKRRIKSGQRVLHVIIPEVVFNHANAQAFLSGIPWQEFVTETLRQCEQMNPALNESTD